MEKDTCCFVSPESTHDMAAHLPGGERMQSHVLGAVVSHPADRVITVAAVEAYILWVQC